MYMVRCVVCDTKYNRDSIDWCPYCGEDDDSMYYNIDDYEFDYDQEGFFYEDDEYDDY